MNPRSPYLGDFLVESICQFEDCLRPARRILIMLQPDDPSITHVAVAQYCHVHADLRQAEFRAADGKAST